jgi:predicted NAD/FAD-binding protein
MLLDIVRFNKHAARIVATHAEEISLTQLLAELKVSKRFSEHYLLPMAGAIWSTGKENILDYPAKKFISFCENHGLLSPKSFNPLRANEGRLQWYTVKHGARTYVEKILDDMNANILLSTGVSTITRTPTGALILDEKGIKREFDIVVCASHPDQTLKMLSDASDAETELLGSFVYTKNKTIMHRDVSCMMQSTKQWPSWTYAEPINKEIELSYYMNRLQNIDPSMPVLVTLNPAIEIADTNLFYETTYEHPRFSLATDAAQKKIAALQGNRNTYFAGAWLGHGFHEDGLSAALTVVRALNAPVPW